MPYDSQCYGQSTSDYHDEDVYLEVSKNYTQPPRKPNFNGPTLTRNLPTRFPPFTNSQIGSILQSCNFTGSCGYSSSFSTYYVQALLTDEELIEQEETGSVCNHTAAEARAMDRMKRVHELKKMYYELKGIQPTQVIPEDNGLWGGDTILSDEQIDVFRLRMRYSFGQQSFPLRRRRRRNALFMDLDGMTVKWTKLPIPYAFARTFKDAQKQLVRHALADIESKTCVRFDERAAAPKGTPHIFYNIGSVHGHCGVSGLGRTGNRNVIHLNFNQCFQTIVGTAIHETLHALGVKHEQLRADRDDYIDIDYSNVDPRALDIFDMSDDSDTTAYGTHYDYFSIMHYSSFVGAIDAKKPTIRPKKDPKAFYQGVMGQRISLSIRDADLISRMYCTPDCTDTDANCGYWMGQGFCDSHFAEMLDSCPKSCGFCPYSTAYEAGLAMRK